MIVRERERMKPIIKRRSKSRKMVGRKKKELGNKKRGFYTLVGGEPIVAKVLSLDTLNGRLVNRD